MPAQVSRLSMCSSHISYIQVRTSSGDITSSEHLHRRVRGRDISGREVETISEASRLRGEVGHLAEAVNATKQELHLPVGSTRCVPRRLCQRISVTCGKPVYSLRNHVST